MPVSRIGRPPGSVAGEPVGQSARGDRDRELGAGADERHEEREKGEREDEVDAELGRVGDRRAGQEAGERREVPHHEEAQLDAEHEGEGALLRRGDDAEGLVGEEEGGDRALAPAEVDLATEREAVEQVPHVEEERREHDLEPRRPGREEPDGAELGAAREDEHRQRLRLEQREAGAAGRDRIGEAERDHAEPERREGPEAAAEGAIVSGRIWRPTLVGAWAEPTGEARGAPARAGNSETPPAAASGGVSDEGVPAGGDS